MEVEVNSLEIVTTDHVGPSNVSHVTRKDADMQTVHTRTKLTFCTSYGVGDHSLEDFPTMLDEINEKKNVNVLSCVQKHDVINTKNLHIVTRQGTKIGSDNPHISKMK